MGEFACVLFKLTEDMIDILRHFQTNLPTVTGDQLSFKRAVNSMHPVSIGHTAEGRLKGFTMQLDNWHTGFKILEVKNVCLKKCMYLLTEWEGRTGKYLARGHGIRTERSEVRAP